MDNKEIKINFSTGDGSEFKFLVCLYKNNSLVNWCEVMDSRDIGDIVSEFYFKPQKQDSCFGKPCKHDGNQRCSLIERLNEPPLTI